MVAIESVPDMTLEAKLLLRDVLGDNNWPTHFCTFACEVRTLHIITATITTFNMKFATTLSAFALCGTLVFTVPARPFWITALSHTVRVLSFLFSQ